MTVHCTYDTIVLIVFWWSENEKRGGFNYCPPIGWIGFGLKVIDKPYIKLEDLYKEIIELNEDSITNFTTKHEALDDTMHCYYCFKYLLKHLGYCKLKYNNDKLLYKDIYDKQDKIFLNKCMNSKQFSLDKIFILYCCCKNGIYDNKILNIFN